MHVIGGIAGDATGAETGGFVQAVLDRHAVGASYYTFPFTSVKDWTALSRIEPLNGG